MINPTARAVGIPWYRGEDYLTLRSRMVDAASLPPVFDQWLSVAEELEQRLRHEGHVVERIFIDHDAFLEWCRKKNCGWDADARARYVEEIVARRHFN
ncbi:MAG TPA: hypothetical protein VHA10_06670 [Hypericibacter adhaerens]|jgi:hypothetical protein|uniref:Uncharacterized protein n=1 Tax=Hypericibacter adhaerens TaxID=2602016 RepID=A0A5J6N6V9_9PROT|nr:hypothetical protein [Hypericibacter adhaerens]QEX22696.1 hypothetical protein FRZ61_26280 [Hypericibacter adhaerens]HWA42876.1 hypothetical protein [Hypericibacter adhaerens]